MEMVFMQPKGRTLLLVSSIFIICFALLAFLLSYICLMFTGPDGAELIAEVGYSELFEAFPSVSVDDLLLALGVMGIGFIISGIYQLLLGILGIVFSEKSKSAIVLILLDIVALIFQTLLVFMFMSSGVLFLFYFGTGLVVYAVYLMGAVRNLRPDFREPTIIGTVDESVMAAVAAVNLDTEQDDVTDDEKNDEQG